MNTRIFMSTIIVLLMLTYSVQGDSTSVLWNDQCPPSFAKTLEEGESLKTEIPDFHRDFRLQLVWQTGKVCRDPNEHLSKEILLTKKALSEILKSRIIPSIDLINNNLLLLSNVDFKSGQGGALVVRFKKDKYVIKTMKTLGNEGKLFITIRLISGDAIDVKQLAEDIFNERILPAKWEKPFYFSSLKRKSKIVSAGVWLARDTLRIDSSGKVYEADSHVPAVWGPIGEGLYKRIDFYTNGKFVSFQLLGGPKLPASQTEEEPSTEK